MDTYTRISPQHVRTHTPIGAIIAGYLAGNRPGYTPNCKGIASRLGCGEDTARQVLHRLQEADLVERMDTGGWVATENCREVINTEWWEIPTNIVTSAGLSAVNKVVYGFVFSKRTSSHSETAMVASIGVSARTISRSLRALQEEGYIFATRQGGGTRKTRHFACISTPAAIPVCEEVDPEDVAFTKAEIICRLGDSSAIQYDVYSAAVEGLTELEIAGSPYVLDGSTIKYSELLGLLDFADAEALASIDAAIRTQRARGVPIRHVKEYVVAGMIRHAREFVRDNFNR